MMECPNCGTETNDRNHTCKKDDGSDFLLSLVIGSVTDSAIIGGIIGGDIGGAILGDLLDGDLFD